MQASLETARLLAVTATFAVSAFAAALLAAQATVRRDQVLLLASFLGLYSVIKVHEFVQLSGGYLFAPHLAGAIFPIMMLLGPAIYFYARAMTAAEPQAFGRRDLWALAGFLVVVAVNTPFYALSAGEKIALITHHAGPQDMAVARFRCDLLNGLFLVFSIASLFAAFRLFQRHTQRLQSLFSNIEDKSLAWLRTLLLIVAIGWSWDSVAEIWSLHGGAPHWFGPASALFELLWISAIAFFGLLQRPVFESDAEASASGAGEIVKYARSALSEERMIRIAANLELAMSRDKIFADPGLSLRALSDRLGVSENYLSQTLNDRLGKNFFDFVNAHRVAEARRRLEATQESVLTIAFAVGFNSRSTFNAAFKKHTGLTPSQCREAIKGAAAPNPTGPAAQPAS
jgi:AraC-like DNA-binding protein